MQSAFWCGQASFFLVLALYLQQGRGLDALQAGLVFTILAVAYLAASARAPALTMRFGRGLVAEGALVLAAGHALLLLAVADVLSTMQNVGNATGVAIIGVLFFGAGADPAHAFSVSVGALCVLLVGVAALTRLLPRAS